MQALTNTQQHDVAQLVYMKCPEREWDRSRATVLTAKSQAITTRDSEALYLHLHKANEDKNIPETQHCAADSPFILI